MTRKRAIVVLILLLIHLVMSCSETSDGKTPSPTAVPVYRIIVDDKEYKCVSYHNLPTSRLTMRGCMGYEGDVVIYSDTMTIIISKIEKE